MNKWLLAIFLVPWLANPALATDLETLEEEAAAARKEMAEAAQRLAEAERRLAEFRGERVGRVLFQKVPGMAFEGLADDTRYSILFHPGPGERRSWIGVVLGEDDPAGGAPVMGLTPGGPARTAGLQRGDVIRAVNGRALGDNGAAELRELLKETEPGERIVLEVDRDGERLEFELETATPGPQLGIELEKIRKLVEEGLPGRRAMVLRRGEDGPPGPFHLAVPEMLLAPGLFLGRRAELVPNHAGLAPYFGTSEGVLVVRIDHDNPLGLKAGDVILRVNQQPVSRPVDVGRNLMHLQPDAPVELDIVREGRDERLEGRAPDRRVGLREYMRPY